MPCNVFTPADRTRHDLRQRTGILIADIETASVGRADIRLILISSAVVAPAEPGNSPGLESILLL